MAALDSSTVERVSSDLTDAEVALAAAEAAHEAALISVAADLEIGLLSPGDAAALTGRTDAALDLARTLVDRLSRALPELSARLDAQEAAAAEKAAAAEAKRRGEVCAAVNEAATKLGTAVRAADKLAGELQRLRAEVAVVSSGVPGGAASDHDRGAPRGAGLPVPTGGWIDEVDFLKGCEALVEVLDGGPRRPLYDLLLAEQERIESVARQHDEILAWVAVRPGERLPQILARADLPDEVRLAAKQILVTAVAVRERADGLRADVPEVPREDPAEAEAAAA